jgi:hypothetical protein
MPIQLEVPGIDEVMWARGDVVFDQLVPTRAPTGGPFGLLRRTGIRIALAAARDMRMLRDYVYAVATLEEIEDEDEREPLLASCYLRG